MRKPRECKELSQGHVPRVMELAFEPGNLALVSMPLTCCCAALGIPPFLLGVSSDCLCCWASHLASAKPESPFSWPLFTGRALTPYALVLWPDVLTRGDKTALASQQSLQRWQPCGIFYSVKQDKYFTLQSQPITLEFFSWFRTLGWGTTKSRPKIFVSISSRMKKLQ